MKVGGTLWGRATAAACCLWTACGKVMPPLAGTEKQAEVAAMIEDQTRFAERCRGGSKHAHVCGPDAVMMFAETMHGACSPVGCFDLGGATEDAKGFKGEHEASVRAVIVQRYAAGLAAEKPGISLAQHFRSLAVEFQQGEAMSKVLMRKLLKKGNRHRDMPAIRRALEDATGKGYGHAFVKKAFDVVEWATSPAAAIRADQMSARLSRQQCAESASACQNGWTALVVRHGRVGCRVAGCVDASAETMVAARMAEAAGNAGEDGHKHWAGALEKQFPFVQQARDLRHFNKHLAVVAKEREEDERVCNEIIQNILIDGHDRDGHLDLYALRFFEELARQHGFVGKGIHEASVILAHHTTSMVLRRASSSLAARAGKALLAVQHKVSAQARTIVRQASRNIKLEEDNAHLRASVEKKNEELAASDRREASLAENTAACHIAASTKERELNEEVAILRTSASDLETQLAMSLDGERSAHNLAVAIQGDLDAERVAREDVISSLQTAAADAQGLAADLAECETSSAARDRRAFRELAVAAEQQQGCADEVASLKSSLRVQANDQAKVESLLAATYDEVDGLRSDVRDRDLESAGIAQRLRDVVEREETLRTTVSLLKQEVGETTASLSDCGTKASSLSNKVKSCQTQLGARSAEAVSLRTAHDEEQKRRVTAQQLANHLDTVSRARAKTIVDHEALAESFKQNLATMNTKIRVADGHAAALTEELGKATEQTRVAQEDLGWCWDDLGDLNSMTADLLSFVAAKMPEAGEDIDATPEPIRALGAHGAYKRLRVQLRNVRLIVASLAQRLEEEQRHLRESSGPCDCADGTMGRNDVENNGVETTEGDPAKAAAENGSSKPTTAGGVDPAEDPMDGGGSGGIGGGGGGNGSGSGGPGGGGGDVDGSGDGSSGEAGGIGSSTVEVPSDDRQNP